MPAITDAAQAIPNIVFDWVVEERFQAIPKWHPAVDKVIPIALRRWKKNKGKNLYKIFFAVQQFKKIINQQAYDLVIDAQGLLKSAGIARLVSAPIAGYAWSSVREKCATYFYHYRYAVSWKQHAVERMRELFSRALHYPAPAQDVHYGLSSKAHRQPGAFPAPYILFFHGTTWLNKHWPENYWIALAKLLKQHHLQVKLSWGTEVEYARSCRIAAHAQAEVLPALDITGLMPVIAGATAVIGVDTGLCHLASALTIPTIALFGPTDPEKTGVFGEKQINLVSSLACAPCLKRVCLFKENPASEWPACFSSLPPSLILHHLHQWRVI